MTAATASADSSVDVTAPSEVEAAAARAASSFVSYKNTVENLINCAYIDNVLELLVSLLVRFENLVESSLQ